MKEWCEALLLYDCTLESGKPFGPRIKDLLMTEGEEKMPFIYEYKIAFY